ncbi:CPBP family intramembrane metalloprotease [Dysgonomonas sp. 521]|uniref:CPBP family intramembrane glutamic endopeptidase n=1 Tax=Dysgonomonas sp. 521 TaxID=2302932 RepID=UPI0013D59086|nr:CPBP family intramembrane glutamic endopeptidase [Dysgonomonas sp. 521]NDV96911.1 CPBP family intramembrane metalloprotease [Dysgonomonas sp. 521]
METTVSHSETVGRYKKPALFFILSTLIPWVFWFAAGKISWIEPYQDKFLQTASILACIGLLAPLGVVYWMTRKNRILRKDISKRFFNFRDIKPVYALATCLIMPISIMLAMGISLPFGYSSEQFIITGNFTFSSGIFPVWFLLILAPVIEELAWHSYGTDSLRSKFNLFNTSLIFGAVWGVWHMPLSTIRDYYQSNLVLEGWIYGLNFLISIIPFVILMNWLYYKTGRNIIVAIVFHITAGFFNELFAPHPDSKIIQTVLLCVLATVVVLKDKKFFFDKTINN